MNDAEYEEMGWLETKQDRGILTCQERQRLEELWQIWRDSR